jgi:hypothetical protein
MKRFYNCQVRKQASRRMREPRLFGVFIVSDELKFPAPQRAVNRKWVFAVREGLRGDDDTVRNWFAYGERLSRVWNAVVLSAELAEMFWDTPPTILADAVEDLGEQDLADLIRQAYCPECYGPSARGQWDAFPFLPTGAPNHGCIIV